ncbi:MAG: glycoside hydrolase family 5 protein [Candidatus Hydrogenedens sp.]|nr:cellulase family glycosylhydrolase [Candidatus Hydrogenedentota bacterium]NLF56689.1 glycoside hydrolase family 5 protein [Candidatus Hydrogenedens sp.]
MRLRETMTLWAALLACVLSAGCGGVADAPPLRDAEGRVVLYHGVNVSNYSKYAPDFLPWHSKEDFARLRDWGFNLVRYLVFWEAIEPERGRYDEAYLAATLERIGWLEELGIDVLVDLHQDLYARPFTGDGFPEWTINDDGHEFTLRQPWNLNYIEPAVRASYRNFWKSDDSRGRYAAMAAVLLERLEGRPNVIGLDIMNEPWPAPLPGFERRVLGPFYEEMRAMRRQRGFTTPLYFEPVIYTSTGWPSALDFTPDPDWVYTPHYYDPLCHEGRPYTFFGKLLMQWGVRGKINEARRFGVPLLYGEIGISPAVEGHEEFLRDLFGLFRRHHIGWTYYSLDKAGHSGFGVLEPDGSPNYGILRHLISVYPQRVAGTNLKTDYGDTHFTLSYDPSGEPGLTVIALPELFAHAKVLVNGQAAAHDPELRRFEHWSRAEDGRQTIRVEW